MELAWPVGGGCGCGVEGGWQGWCGVLEGRMRRLAGHCRGEWAPWEAGTPHSLPNLLVPCGLNATMVLPLLHRSCLQRVTRAGLYSMEFICCLSFKHH